MLALDRTSAKLLGDLFLELSDHQVGWFPALAGKLLVQGSNTFLLDAE